MLPVAKDELFVLGPEMMPFIGEANNEAFNAAFPLLCILKGANTVVLA